jgi:hypothetical protein
MSTTSTGSDPLKRRSRLALAVAGGVAAMALAACGGGSDGSSSGTTAPATTAAAATAAAATPAAEWVASVCGAISTWKTELTSGAPDFSQVTDVQSTKQTLGDYLEQVKASTDTLIADIEAAGTPDVENGEAIAQEFKANLATVGDSFQQAKADLDALSTDDPAAFASGLQEIAGALTTAGSEAGQAFDKLATEYPDSGLDEAAADAPACAALG